MSRRVRPAPPPPAAGDRLGTPIQFVRGVGPARAALLGRLGVATVRDALFLLPRRYDDRRTVTPIGRAVPGTVVSVTGTVEATRLIRTRRPGGGLFEVVLSDGTATVTGVWFHFREAWMRRLFTHGKRFVFHGEVRRDGPRRVIHHPEAEEAPGEGDESLHVGRIVPVYPLVEGLGQRQMRRIMHETVREYAPLVQETLPGGLLARYHLPGLAESLANLHYPGEGADPAALNAGASPWHKRLVFEEFFFLELWLLDRRRARERAVRRRPLEDRPELVGRFTAGLPFRLTPDQLRAFEEIRGDLLSPHPMHRLLQGEVGSGKTVVAALAVLLAAGNGRQAAVMAPTEILARQHHRTLARLFAGVGVEIVLVTGSRPAAERREALAALSEGRARVAVGTHALLREGVVFRKLGLVVVDEQHRFGVGHRLELREKGDNPDTLVITATPIPRTLAMALYGDMDISVLAGVPPGRQRVDTRLFGEEERELVWGLVRGELDRGGRAFVVYPLVEESDRSALKAVEKMAGELAREVFPGHPVGVLHGRLKAAEKAAVMDRFREGEVRVLVATTVVEVGVDVPEATVMVVEHAERFGLAQLHQLRGRVGRGGDRALCLLVASEGTGAAGLRRLEALVGTADGFQLAEEDLRARGPGELAGVRQWGAPDFLLADIIRHRKALEFARKEAEEHLAGRKIEPEGLTRLLGMAHTMWQQRARYLSTG